MHAQDVKDGFEDPDEDFASCYSGWSRMSSFTQGQQAPSVHPEQVIAHRPPLTNACFQKVYTKQNHFLLLLFVSRIHDLGTSARAEFPCGLFVIAGESEIAAGTRGADNHREWKGRSGRAG